MSHEINVKINFNKERSFCYYNKKGERIRVYNGNNFNKNLFPNKEKNLNKRKFLLNELKTLIENNLNSSKQTNYLKEESKGIVYEQSIYKERIPIKLFEHQKNGSKSVALEIANLIRDKQSKGRNCVLGLATGSSPISIYNELIRMYREEKLSFHNVITFNLDEYFPMQPNSLHSYHKFMFDVLFDHIDIQKKNINIPKGDLDPNDIEKYCLEFENKIKYAGGLDFQLLGIGRNGHIGFNEPGSIESSITRKVKIEETTRFDAADEFIGINNVPKDAISMGVKTILEAKRIVLVAWGDTKADIIKKSVEEKVSELIPASLLQKHSNCSFILDKESASSLNRMRCPWVYTNISKKPKNNLSTYRAGWSNINIKKAVIWLSLKKKKPILQLTDEDYNENGMGGIFEIHKSAYVTNIHVFNMLEHSITGWPGGKANSDDLYRPERSKPNKKRVLIFSPHPDDDVISMGGTFSRLINQGHDVHVAYQTSGNIAVSDEKVLEIAELIKRLTISLSVKDLNKLIRNEKTKIEKHHIIWGAKFYDSLKGLLREKIDLDGYSILNKIKGIIRKSEAFQACDYLGLEKDKIYNLDMPFYQTGKIKKKELSNADIEIVQNLINKIKPHQIFAAGDLSDPHGTHRLCLRSIYNSINNLRSKSFIRNCFVWLYKGAWDEWRIDEIDMAVPLSPNQILKKRRAIYKHLSQKDVVSFPGQDKREFWQRAEDRNKNTAELFSELGLAKYGAMEAFKRYYF